MADEEHVDGHQGTGMVDLNRVSRNAALDSSSLRNPNHPSNAGEDG